MSKVAAVMQPVVDFLIARRRKLKLTQLQVAKAGGLSRRALQNWESGGGANITFANVVRWANTLGYEIKFVRKQ